MVTGDLAVPRNNEHGPDGLRNITPYLDLCEAFGADLIRICMKKDEDIENIILYLAQFDIDGNEVDPEEVLAGLEASAEAAQ